VDYSDNMDVKMSVLQKRSIMSPKKPLKGYRTPITPNATPQAQELVREINKIRIANKLPTLVEDKRLNQSANKKAKDMVSKNYWSHKDPQGKMSWDIIKKSGYNYDYAGENLANKYDDKTSLSEWMKSPKHKENILNSKYTDIGVGKAGDFNVLHFGRESK